MERTGTLAALASLWHIGGMRWLAAHGSWPTARRSRLHRLPPLDRIRQHGLVGVFECGACGQAAGEACDLDVRARFELLGEVEAGAIAFERGVEAQNDLADGRAPAVACGLVDAFKERGDGEVAGADPIERAEAAHEHVVHALVHAGEFEGEQVFGLLDDQHEAAVALVGAADGAGVAIGEVEADAAALHAVFHIGEGAGQVFGDGGLALEDVKGETLGGAAADAGQGGETVDQSLYGLGVGGGGGLAGGGSIGHARCYAGGRDHHGGTKDTERGRGEPQRHKGHKARQGGSGGRWGVHHGDTEGTERGRGRTTKAQRAQRKARWNRRRVWRRADRADGTRPTTAGRLVSRVVQSCMASAVPRPVDVLQRMVDAVEQVRQRLVRASAALRAGGVAYAVVGGNAVAAWVATVDKAAVRNTQDVDVLIRRGDFGAAKAALEGAGFVYRHTAGVDMFVDHATASARDAVHILFASEFVRPGEPVPNPDVNESTEFGALRVIDLEALVRIKLTAFRRKDQVHLLDMIGVGLVDASWAARLAPPLAARLQQLLDTPDG